MSAASESRSGRSSRTEQASSPLLDQLVERLQDLSYRGRCMTGPGAHPYARFMLPVLQAGWAHRTADVLEDAALKLGAFSTVDDVLWELRDLAEELRKTTEATVDPTASKSCPCCSQAVLR